ncbi:MAG: ATP-binding cassette domain-containing protein [Gammaproteobacteria bacterium]|nr:ATP-binding cassette domain-containing protein [Gammaproteobacteria bacterium]
MKQVLEVIEATKNYGRLTALHQLSLTVQAREFVALLGPNGAGRSSLFQLLTGLFVPDEGSIRVAGLELEKDPVSARKIIWIR